MTMRARAWVAAIVASAGATVCCSSSSSPVATSSGALSPSTGWNGCTGSFDTTESPTGAYFVTDFGCSSSPRFTDTSDNCCPSGVVEAASDGLCTAGTTTSGCTDSTGTTSAVACERAVNWFSTGGSTFGLGTRLRLTRPDNGVSVVVFVIDNGPACYREQQFGGYALDISYPAIMALYGSEEGVSDRKTVSVTVVPATTPLGRVTVDGGTVSVDAGGGGHDSGSVSHDAGSTSHDAGHDTGSVTHDAGGRTPDTGGSSEDSGVPDASGADATSGTDAGMPCTGDGECNPGSDGSGMYCSGGHCIPGCDADWECPGDTTCVDMSCQ